MDVQVFQGPKKYHQLRFFSGFRMVLPVLEKYGGAGSLVPLEMSDRPNMGGRAKLDHHGSRQEFGAQEEVQPSRIAACVKAIEIWLPDFHF